MYSLEQLYNGVRYPRVALRELNRLFWTRGDRRSFNPAGVDVFEEDWDNLLILDGCRHDYFAATVGEYDIPGQTAARTSRGSATWEFLRGNFDGRRLHDTVYVTASTMLYQETAFRDRIDVELHETIDVWSDGIDYGQAGVTPGDVAEATRRAVEQYPNKRLLVHFVQPHAPYIGPKGRELFPDFRANPLANRFLGNIDTSTADLREIYAENLRVALAEVETLVDDLPGRTVISADHGMLLGERERPIPIRSFGHPGGMYVEEMVRVPWHSFDNGPRKRIVAEAPTGGYDAKRDEGLDEKAKQHLAQLGYR